MTVNGDHRISGSDVLSMVQRHGRGGQVLAVNSLVDGAWRTGSGDALIRTSPTTGSDLFSAGSLEPAEVEAAIEAARREFDHGTWGRSTGRDRAKVLWRAGELIDQHRDRLAELLVLEAGKPVREARGEVAAVVNAFEYFAGLARDVGGRTSTDIAASMLAMTLREPAGVAGLIVPWNFPLAILGQKLPSALAAGCTAVVKPSPLTPLSSLAVAELLYTAGLPGGALSVVLGGADAGARVVTHPDVDVVSFTGSTETARVISAVAGSERLKRLVLEAGGKTPVIVLRDSDLDTTVDGLLFSSFFNQGQVCVAGSRIMAEGPVADELTARLADRSAGIVLGDPWSDTTEMGPLIAREHFDSVVDRVRRSVAAGAQLATGGEPVALPDTAAAPFLAPTVLRTDDDTNVAAQEEIFGPVTVVQRFDDIDEVVARANTSVFGLAASVWTSDVDAALRLTRALRVGTVWVNGSTDSFPEIPLGGRRDSGHGAEFGREGMEFFTALKTVQIRTGGPATPWYGVR